MQPAEQRVQDIMSRILFMYRLNVGGVGVKVVAGGSGHDMGEIEFRGEMYNQTWWGHFAVGGQELWIDSFYWEY